MNVHYSVKNIGVMEKKDQVENICITEKKCSKNIRYLKTGSKYMIQERM